MTRYDEHYPFRAGQWNYPHSYLNDRWSHMTDALWLLNAGWCSGVGHLCGYGDLVQWIWEKIAYVCRCPCDSMQSMNGISLKSRANWRACELQYDHSLSCKSAWAQIIDPLSAGQLPSNILSLALLASFSQFVQQVTIESNDVCTIAPAWIPIQSPTPLNPTQNPNVAATGIPHR